VEEQESDPQRARDKAGATKLVLELSASHIFTHDSDEENCMF